MDYQVLAAARTVLPSAAVRIGLLLLVAMYAREAAAQPAPRTITLHEAITYARIHQPSLAAARARVEVAREAARLPRAARDTPQIALGAEIGLGTNNNTTTMYGPLDFVIPR